MAETVTKNHPLDSTGNPVSLQSWCQANLSSDDFTIYNNADKYYIDEIVAAGLSYSRTASGWTITYPESEESFWATRTSIRDAIEPYWTQYRADPALTWI